MRLSRLGWAVLCAAGCTVTICGAQSDSSPKFRRTRVPPVYREYKPIEVKEGGTLSGVVVYKGTVPAPEKIQITKDQPTCGKHPTQRARLIVNSDKQVKEAIVFLNIKAGKPLPKEETKPILNQMSCDFSPHVAVIGRSQPFDILNSDPVAHNIQATQNLRTVFNHLQPQQNMKQEEKFSELGVVALQCQAHEWMKAWRYVLPHPYYAVTGEDGAFKITDIPPGEYELHLWQEYTGEQYAKVKIEPGKTVRIELELLPK